MATAGYRRGPSLPPYPQMIMEALGAMKLGEGASKSLISQYMESNYGEMPLGHVDSLSQWLAKMKSSGELLFIKNNYMKPWPDAPTKHARGRPSKPKESLPLGTDPKPRGRPRKDPNEPPTSKKPKLPSGTVSISKTGRPRGRPRKVSTELFQDGAEGARVGCLTQE